MTQSDVALPHPGIYVQAQLASMLQLDWFSWACLSRTRLAHPRRLRRESFSKNIFLFTFAWQRDESKRNGSDLTKRHYFPLLGGKSNFVQWARVLKTCEEYNFFLTPAIWQGSLPIASDCRLQMSPSSTVQFITCASADPFKLLNSNISPLARITQNSAAQYCC